MTVDSHAMRKSVILDNCSIVSKIQKKLKFSYYMEIVPSFKRIQIYKVFHYFINNFSKIRYSNTCI